MVIIVVAEAVAHPVVLSMQGAGSVLCRVQLVGSRVDGRRVWGLIGTSVCDQHSGSMKIATELDYFMVIVKRHLVQIGRTDVPTECLS